MKVKLHDVVKELEKEGFKLAVKTEGAGLFLTITNPRANGTEDHVARLNLHNNVVGCHEEDVFWNSVALYRQAQKQQDGA